MMTEFLFLGELTLYIFSDSLKRDGEQVKANTHCTFGGFCWISVFSSASVVVGWRVFSPT